MLEVGIRLREIGVVGDAARVPLLVVLDGPDYVRRTSLLRLLRTLVEAQQLPPHRVALLAADDQRAETYSASTLYARALIASLDEVAGRRPRRVGLGSSLGALALLASATL